MNVLEFNFTKEEFILEYCKNITSSTNTIADDIFIPELNLAVEYQGAQHFKAVPLFGGDEGLKKAKERDKIKKLRCK